MSVEIHNREAEAEAEEGYMYGGIQAYVRKAKVGAETEECQNHLHAGSTFPR